MCKRSVLWFTLAFLFGITGAGWAEDDVNEDSLFDGGNEKSLFGESASKEGDDEDSLFGGDLVTNDIADTSASTAAEIATAAFEDLLTSDAATVGGSIDFTVKLRTDPEEIDEIDDIAKSYDLTHVISIDARPDPDFRVYLKTELDYSGQAVADTDIEIAELFSDVTLADWFYLRAGKQNMKWGSGFFFSPADLLSLEKVDPEDPEAEPAGPVAARLHLPYRTTNFYAYATLNDLPDGGNAGFAAKAEFIAGGSEFTFGGYYKRDSVSGAMATYAGSLWDFELFAEAVAQYGSTIAYVEDDGAMLTTTRRSETWFPLGTAGLRYSWSDDDGYFDLRLAGQYYYNGEGYVHSEILADDQIGLLLASGELSPKDFQGTGQHYAAASAGWSKAFGTDLSLSGFWIGNLSDESGRVTADLTWRINDYVSISPGYTYTYGDDDDEFGRIGTGHSVRVDVSLGTGAF